MNQLKHLYIFHQISTILHKDLEATDQKKALM